MKGIKDTSLVRKKVGERLGTARKGKGLSRPGFASLLLQHCKAPTESNVCADTNLMAARLKQWEYGNNPVELEWIPAICDILECDTGYLFGEYEAMQHSVADICQETGLSESAVKWICGIRSKRTIGKKLSNQLLDALSSLITADEFSLILRDLVGLKSAIARTNQDTPPASFAEEFKQWDCIEKAKREVQEGTNGKYTVLPANGYVDTLKFRLSKAFNNVVDEIAEGGSCNG